MEVSTIGERIKTLRKKEGTTRKIQQPFLEKLSVLFKNMKAGKLKCQSQWSMNWLKCLILPLPIFSDTRQGISNDCLSDVMECLFQLKKINGLHFSIETKRPPHHDGWQCSITFDGKDKSAEQNADMCLFLEEWENNRESFQHYCIAKDVYEDWKDKTLAYYASQGVEIKEPENLDTKERLKRRNSLFSGK